MSTGIVKYSLTKSQFHANFSRHNALEMTIMNQTATNSNSISYSDADAPVNQCSWCVDAVLRLLGVFHDVLYGDVNQCMSDGSLI